MRSCCRRLTIWDPLLSRKFELKVIIPLFKSWRERERERGKEESRERRGKGKKDVEFALLPSSFSSWAGKRSAPSMEGAEEEEQPMMMESHRIKRSSGEAEDASDEVM